MPQRRARPLTIRHAVTFDGERHTERDLYCADRFLSAPHPDAVEVDLRGLTLLPGLVNAHDHLELNHYPRTRFREVYANAHQWGEDVNARLDTEPYASLRAYPLADRCFIGGLKNLLSGVTTVAHHGPPHRPLFQHDFPVRVLRDYGWAHSLHFSTEAEIVESYRRTPPDLPWFIHLAEGTDAVARGEYRRLKALGCVGPNTVLVHGVGLTEDDIADAVQRVRGLVWCPTTNAYLLGETADVQAWGDLAAIGSDSRLTAEGDFLDEVRGGIVAGGFAAPEALTRFMLRAGRRLLGMAGDPFTPGQAADFWIQGGHPVRDNIRLIVRGGVPLIGDADLMHRFPHVRTVPVMLDGAPKAMHVALARKVAACTLKEPGLALLEDPPPRWQTLF